jgi:hypothetical protein
VKLISDSVILSWSKDQFGLFQNATEAELILRPDQDDGFFSPPRQRTAKLAKTG